MTRKARFALVLLATACGARSPLDGPSPPVSAPATCAPPPASPAGHCVAWKAAGPVRSVPPPPPAGSAVGGGAVVASGCGVLAAWSTTTISNGGLGPTTLAWSTRMIGFDGAPLSDAHALAALTAQTDASGAVSLATSGAHAGALVADSTGCKFAPLDARGAGDGSVSALEAPLCLALAPAGDGFSFLDTTSDGASPASLTTIDPQGVLRATAPLGVPADRAVWDRLVLGDGSFLLYTFREDPTSGVYTSWLQHYGARGASLAAEVDIGANTAPVLLAPTPTGALAAWGPVGPGGPRIEIVAVDPDGVATGAPATIAAEGPLYGESLVAVPDGDVMLVWLAEVASASGGWRLSAQALGPDGAARGAATVLLEGVEAEPVRGVVESGGARGVLVFGGSVLPVECAGGTG